MPHQFFAYKRPEVLAPAGTPEAMQAALAAGADAIYFGAGPFHARSQAVSFSLDTLADTVAEIHRQGAQAYLTFNTLVFSSEWAEAGRVARIAYEAGIDALIVQDLGLCEALHNLLPHLPLHASTQMALHNAQALHQAKQAGVCRVVLPRELTLEEIRSQTALARSLGLETEVFVQGALCVCYSGHCHLSRVLGGRSANRGSCAQPCRHPYRLRERSGKLRPLLSPKDISYLDSIEALTQAGVSSLKIEGRMRSPEYVATAVSLYRQAEEPKAFQSPFDRQDLLQAFNRGGSFTTARLTGKRGRSFLSGLRSGNMGILLGKTDCIVPQAGYLEFPLIGPAPQKGDTLVLRSPEGEDLASAPITNPEVRGDRCRIRGFHPAKLRKLPAETWVYRARSAELTARVQRLVRQAESIQMQLTADRETVTLRLKALNREEVEAVFQTIPCEETSPLAEERIRQQLGKLGGTGLRLSEVKVQGEIRLRISSLNALRRAGVEAYLASKSHCARPALEENWIDRWIEWGKHPGGNHPDFSPHALTRAIERPSLPNSGILHLPGWRAGDPLPQSSSAIALPLASLLSLSSEETAPLFHSAEIWVFVPSGASLSIYDRGSQAYAHWLSEGLRGQITAGLAHLGEPSQPGPWLLAADANVANPATWASYRRRGVGGMALAEELNANDRATILATDPEAYVLTGKGAQETMLFAHCPVGYGEPDCHQCQTQRAFTLEDARGRSFPYLPLPDQDCSGRLYAPESIEPIDKSLSPPESRMRVLWTKLPLCEG